MWCACPCVRACTPPLPPRPTRTRVRAHLVVVDQGAQLERVLRAAVRVELPHVKVGLGAHVAVGNELDVRVNAPDAVGHAAVVLRGGRAAQCAFGEREGVERNRRQVGQKAGGQGRGGAARGGNAACGAACAGL